MIQRIVTSASIILLLMTGTSFSAHQLISAIHYKELLGPFATGDTTIKSYSFSLHLLLKLADSTDINYLDINDGFIHCGIFNGSPGSMSVSTTYNHLWVKGFSVQHNWDSLEGYVPDRSDSLNAFLGTGGLTTVVPSYSSEAIGKLNLSSSRLFILRDTISNGSALSMGFDITLSTPDDSLTISENDSIVIDISLKNISAIDRRGREWMSDTGTVRIVRSAEFEKTKIRPVNNASLQLFFRGSRHSISYRIFADKSINGCSTKRCFFTLMGRKSE